MKVTLDEKDTIWSEEMPKINDVLEVEYQDTMIGTAEVISVNITDIYLEGKSIGIMVTLDLIWNYIGGEVNHQWRKKK